MAAFENDLKDNAGPGCCSTTARRRDPAAAAAGADRQAVEGPGRRRHRDRAGRQTYQDWMLGELDALDKALAGRASERDRIRRRHDRARRRDVLADVSLGSTTANSSACSGPNGAGKTTLMRAILGLVPPSAGAIRVLGKPARAAIRSIGYMPQIAQRRSRLRLSRLGLRRQRRRWSSLGPAAAVTPRGTPRGRLGAGARWRRASSPGVRSARLSGGERQRLLLAQALLGRPRLLLLDEPLISLDPAPSARVVELARAVCSELGDRRAVQRP